MNVVNKNLDISDFNEKTQKRPGICSTKSHDKILGILYIVFTNTKL